MAAKRAREENAQTTSAAELVPVNSEDAPARTLFGGKPHQLTDEERAKGRAAALAKRREMGRTVRERFAQKLEREADALFKAFSDAYQAGDWKAAEAILNQAFGRTPAEGEAAGSGQGLTIHIESAFITPNGPADSA